MKAKIEGIEVEGTPDEIMQIVMSIKGKERVGISAAALKSADLFEVWSASEKQLQERIRVELLQPKQEKKKPIFVSASPKRKYKKRTVKELKAILNKVAALVITNQFPTPNQAFVSVFGRSYGGKEMKMLKRVINKMRKAQGCPVASPSVDSSATDHKYMANAKRFSWCNKRAKVLCDGRHDLSYAEALSIASGEWLNGFRQDAIPASAPAKMPIIFKNEAENKLLLEMLANVSNTQSKFCRIIEGKILNEESWADWANLCADIFAKSGEIAAYLGVPNHFKLVKSDVNRGQDYITYGG